MDEITYRIALRRFKKSYAWTIHGDTVEELEKENKIMLEKFPDKEEDE